MPVADEFTDGRDNYARFWFVASEGNMAPSHSTNGGAGAESTGGRGAAGY